MKIAFVITGLGIGGAEKVVVSLADSLVDRGHEVLIIYLTGEAMFRPVNPSIRLVGLKIYHFGNLITSYFRLRKLVLEFRPDVVHSHLFHANIIVRLLRLTTILPRVITTAHINCEVRFRMLIYRVTDRLADISTNVSDEAVSTFISQNAVKKGRMLTVHNGISTHEYRFQEANRSALRRELNISDQCKLILAVGRLYEQKDYPNLFMALKKIGEDAGEYQVCIAGDGPLREYLSAMLESFGLCDRVRFLGIRRDVAKLLSAADVFVLSSSNEGFPLVVGEAMASECVIVATDAGGVKEFVGSAGYIVPTHDPVTLSNALKVALGLSVFESKILGYTARDRIQELYSLDMIVNKWLKLYCDAPAM